MPVIKDQEKVAADALKRFLNERLRLKAEWKPGANPLDFVFTVEEETWAVEEKASFS